MTSYPFQRDLFKNILSKSHAIIGRFHLLERASATEINSDVFNEVLQDLVVNAVKPKTPFCAALPPKSLGVYNIQQQEWEQYLWTMFFLTTTFSTSNNQIKSPNKNTNTSTHTVPDVWHDMRRCAVNFIRVGKTVVKNNSLQARIFYFDNDKIVITPVSFAGQDKLSGVRLDFKTFVYTGCDIEDYSTGDIAGIVVPADDPHPEHKM